MIFNNRFFNQILSNIMNMKYQVELLIFSSGPLTNERIKKYTKKYLL